MTAPRPTERRRLRFGRASPSLPIVVLIVAAVVALLGLTAYFLWMADTSAGADPEDVVADDPSATASSRPAVAGTDALDGARIIVGSMDFDEQRILGAVSEKALQAAGAEVTQRLDLATADDNRQALLDGTIDHYWEYTGSGWSKHLGNTEAIADPDEQYRAVRDADLSRNDLVWLQPSVFNNTYGIAFRREAARRLGNPESLSDLSDVIAERRAQATLCLENVFETSEGGLADLQDAYGFEFPNANLYGVNIDALVSTVDRGRPCNFGEVFTTDGRIAALDLEVLTDDRNFFPVYRASPVITRELYEQYGEALDTCFTPIAEALTQKRMIELNKRVSSDGERPQAVAESFLNDNDLLGGCEGG